MTSLKQQVVLASLISFALTVACGGEETTTSAVDVMETQSAGEATEELEGSDAQRVDGESTDRDEQDLDTPVQEGQDMPQPDLETSAEGQRVIVGVYSYDADADDYVDLNRELEFQVGVVCQTWTRWVESPRSSDPVSGPHDHYNAADEVVFEDDELTWLEYGPEHSQREIDATCGAGEGGAPKRANMTEYIAGNGTGQFFLKIKRVE